MGFTLLEDVIETDVISSKKYNSNVHTLINLRSSLISTMETSKNFINQSESFVASSFILASDFNRIGLQFPDISVMSTSLIQFNKEVNQLLPQSLRECKFLLDYTLENGIPFDHSEIFKSLKVEMDKFLVESNIQRKELRTLLLKYSKSSSDSTNDKIASTMAKLNQSIYQYEKYQMLIENELSEFVTRKHEFLFNLSKNIINLHQLVHFGKTKLLSTSSDQELKVQPSTTPPPTPTFTFSNLPPQNFKDLLDMPIYLKAFRIFSEKQHCLENLLFWLDANTLKELEVNQYPRNRVRSLFLNIYGNYIIKDCNYEINIDSDSRVLIENRKNTVDEDLPFFSSLVLAVENVYTILNLSMFPLFLQNPLYHAASTLTKSMASPIDSCLSENRGVFHCINSIDSIIRNPITIEYFILFLKQLNPHQSSLAFSSGSSSGNGNGMTNSNSNNNISGLMSHQHHQSSLTNSSGSNGLDGSGGNGNNNNNNIVPPLALSLSPKLLPLITPWSINQNTQFEIINMISFYLEINKFKDSEESLLDNYAIEIYDIYLKPGCDKQITTIIYTQIQDMISSKSVTKDMFKNVGLDVLLHISNTYFQSFLNSNICKEMLQREEKMKKYIDREEKKKQDPKIDLQFELILKEKFKLVIPNYKNYLTTSNNNNNNNSNNNNSNNNSVNSNNSNNSSNGNSNNTHKLQQTNLSSSLTSISNSNSGNSSSSSGGTSKSVNSSPSLSSTSSAGERIRSGVVQMFSPSLTMLSIGGSGSSHSSSTSTTPSVPASPLSSGIPGTVSPRISNDQPLQYHQPLPQIPQQHHNNSHHHQQQQPSLLDEPNELFAFILNDSGWLDAFKKYVKHEKCEEILLFWLEIDSFIKQPRSFNKSTTAVKVAYNIYETFIREGSPLEVNIEYDIRAQCKQSITNKSEDEIDEAFKYAAQSVLEMIRVGSYKNFLKSNLYKDVCSQLGDPTKTKNKKR